jgi:hypothetical protein
VFQRLRPGQVVFAYSGERLGNVNEVGEDRFLVRNGTGDGTWLRADALLEVDAHSVRLICNRSRLSAYVVGDGGGT